MYQCSGQQTHISQSTMSRPTTLSCYCFLLVTWISFTSAAPPILCDVLVLGGGMAGVSAVKTLHDKGVRDVVLVEGGDKLGGRIRAAHFGGVNVELGVNWPPMWEGRR